MIEIINFIITIILINSILSVFTKKSVFYCGIIGFSGTKPFDLSKIKTLLVWNALARGEDATGVFTPKTGIVKDNISAVKFATKHKITEVKEDTLLVAHVRKKSIGFNTVRNAHPNEVGDIVSVHNGTLHNHDDLVDSYKLDPKDYDTDSQILTACLNHNYNNNNDFKVLGEYKGAAALLVYNKDTEKLYALRDFQRPLFYGYIDETEMYISSIEESLLLIGCSKVEKFSPEKIYEISKGEIIEKTDYPKEEIKRTSYVSQSQGDRTIVLANASDVITNYYGNDPFRKLMPNSIKYTGFTAASCEPKYLIGYNLRYHGTTVQYKIPNPGEDKLFEYSLTKGNHYRVVGLNSKQPKHVRVRDNHGLVKSVSIFKFDIGSFIFVEGDYVKTICRVENALTKIAYAKDSILRVTHHSWPQTRVALLDEYTGHTCWVDISDVRLCDEQEINRYNELYELFKNSNIKTLPESTSKTDKEENEFPFKEAEDYEINHSTDNTPIIPTDDEEEEEEYISKEHFLTIIGVFYDILDEIVQKYKSGGDIKEDLISFQADITGCLEDDVLNELLDKLLTKV